MAETKKDLKIFAHLDAIVEAYREPVTRVTGLPRKPKEIIRTVEFYSNDTYLNGNKDSLEREKPFYNVGNYRVTVAKVGTDLDVKHFKYEPDDLQYSTAAMIINHELFKFLKEINFSETLNDAGVTRPKFGGFLLKKSEQNGGLQLGVVEWVNIDFDPSDVIGGVMVETFWMQPSELYEQYDAWEPDAIDEFVTEHVKAHKNKPVKLEIKEVSGEFPETFSPEAKDNAKDSKFRRMCFYIGIVNKKKFLLSFNYEKECRYEYLAWEKMGKGLGRGVWEEGFESQVWTNDSMIAMKNAMELAGKVLAKTTSKKLSGNVITGVDHGHIFELEQNAQFEVLNLAPSALPQFQNLIGLWKQQFDQSASTYTGANTGEAPPANTPYSQTALLNQVANSPFEYRREEAGIFWNRILNKWILPEVKKRCMKEHYLTSEFTAEELEMIDHDIHVREANSMKMGKILSPLSDDLMKNIPTQGEELGMQQAVTKSLSGFGSKRTVHIPKGYLDVEGHITANITGELKDKQAILTSLDSIMKTIQMSFNPNTGTYGVFENKALSEIFSQIMEIAGSPISSARLKFLSKSSASQPDLSAPALTPQNGQNGPTPTPVQ